MRIFVLLISLIISGTALGQGGDLDITFDPGSGANGSITTVALQANGKILIGGSFTTYGGFSRNGIARLNSDGTLDVTFNPGSGPNFLVNAIAEQTDGKIIIGGNFTSYNGASANYVLRLNSDGTIDGTFDPGNGCDSPTLAIAIQADGKIIIGGSFTLYKGTSLNRIARLNTDGNVDASFNMGIGVGGSLSYIKCITIQQDGKIIISGDMGSYNASSANGITRINTDGTRDYTFSTSVPIDPDGHLFISSVGIQTNGKVVCIGDFLKYIISKQGTGQDDPIFSAGSGLNSIANCLAVQGNGKIIIGGGFTLYNNFPNNRLLRLNPDGSIDATFNIGAGPNQPINTSIIQADGKIIIAGDFTSYNGTGRSKIARLMGLCGYVWSGNTSSDWTVASNWLGGIVPDINSEVNIPPNTLYSPIVPAGVTVNCKSLYILKDANLSLGTNAKVNVTH